MLKFVVSVMAFAYVCVLSLYAGDEYKETQSKALAHFIMAEVHDFNGNSAEAMTEYQRSASLDKSQHLPHLRLASHYARSGLMEKAHEELKAVEMIDPTNAQSHYLLALVFSSQKKFDLAAREYEKILNSKIDNLPENLEIHTNLAHLYFSQKKFSKAIEEFKQILSIDANNPSSYYLLGSAYLEINDPQNAKEQFRKALKIEPSNDQSMNSLAYVYALLNENLDDALILAQKSVDADGSNGAYYDTLGWVLHKKGLNAESLLALQRAEVYIKDPVLFDHMADVYKDVKQYALARKYWRKSLELDPTQPTIQSKISSLEKIQALKEQ